MLKSATAATLCGQMQESLLSVPHLYEAGQRNVRFRYNERRAYLYEDLHANASMEWTRQLGSFPAVSQTCIMIEHTACTRCSPRVLSLWVASAIWHSLVCFYVPALALSAKSAVSSAGQITDIWATGTLAYTVVIVVVCGCS